MKKNITLSAEEELIQKARERAHREHTTLNAEFRKWLRRYALSNSKVVDYLALMESLSYVKAGRKFTRDEMNER